MKIKQILALLLAISMLLLVVSCEENPAQTTESTKTSESTTESTTESTEPTTTESTVFDTQATTAENTDLPIISLEDAAKAVLIKADPVTETEEIPLIVILANFDADGDGVDDWDPGAPDMLYKDKTAANYGEQWAGSELSDHYDTYFGDDYSLSNYYEELSMGAFRFVPIEFDVVPEGSPYTNGILEVTVNLPHPSALGTLIDNSTAAQQCITAVFEATDPYVDYSKYDKNGNGVIDATELGVIILNPGQDNSNGNNKFGGRQYFQVHGTSQPLTAYMDGVSFFKVSNFGEYGPNSAPMTMGTPAHELAHNLGAEDLYDTRRNGHSGTNITGWPRAYNFSLESNGNHLANGTRPAYLDPYHRIYLGWADYEVVEDGVYTIKSTLTDEYKILRVNTPDPGEYFLIEIRLKEGFESNLTKGDGLGGIMIWHIDQDLCDRFFVEGSASTSTKLNGEHHDPAIVPLFRNSFDADGRYMSVTAPQDPFYYYDPMNPEAAVFDSANFRSVTNGTPSLNSYPANWEGPENYNLHVEVLSAPGQEMTVKITSGTKTNPESVSASFTSITHNTLSLKGALKEYSKAVITNCAIAISTSEDFSENYMAKTATLSEDGKSFTAEFTELTPSIKYYYKVYFDSDCGYAEDTASITTSSPPKEKTSCRVNLYTDPDAKRYDIEAKYGKTVEIPSGWLNSVKRKKPGMEIEGWYYDPEFTKPFDFTTVIEKGTEDFDLYAKWVPAE